MFTGHHFNAHIPPTALSGGDGARGGGEEYLLPHHAATLPGQRYIPFWFYPRGKKIGEKKKVVASDPDRVRCFCFCGYCTSDNELMEILLEMYNVTNIYKPKPVQYLELSKNTFFLKTCHSSPRGRRWLVLNISQLYYSSGSFLLTVLRNI